MNSVAPGTTKHLFLSLSDVFVLVVWLVGCIFARLVVVFLRICQTFRIWNSAICMLFCRDPVCFNHWLPLLCGINIVFVCVQ